MKKCVKLVITENLQRDARSTKYKIRSPDDERCDPRNM